MSKVNWNEVNTAKLVELAGEGVVTQDALTLIAEEMDTSTRSVGAKLRKLDFEVEKATGKAPSWTEAQEAELRAFVEANAGNLTYVEISEQCLGGEFNAKQVQGKLLNMELFGSVKKAEKKVIPRKYSEAEEAKMVAMIVAGSTIENISDEFDKPVTSIRGKALSLLRAGLIEAMPKQEKSTAKSPVDVLGEVDVAGSTVAQIAAATEKTERGIKSILTRKGLTCVDYDGAARKEKLETSKEA